MRPWIPLLMLLAVFANCSTVGTLSIGTTVPIDELQRQTNLRAWVSGEIESGEIERAFYAMELLKTRSYAAQRLLAQNRQGAPTASVHHDLRPLFAEVFGDQNNTQEAPTLVASRGLMRIGASPQKQMLSFDAAADKAFWDDQRLFRKRIAAQMPNRHALLHSFAVTTSDEALGIVAGSDVALSFFIDGEQVRVFVLQGQRMRVVSLRSSTSELRAMTRALLAAVSAPPATADDTNWLQHAARLYDALLAPLHLSQDSIKGLYVVPDGFLGSVPFALLAEPIGSERHILLERMRVSYLPSITIYRRLMMREILERPPAILAIGNPGYSVPVPDLPSAEREARVVSNIFATKSYLKGQEASESAIRKALPKYNLLHFATHGVLLGQHVPGASSLLVAADDENDGLLSAAEISGLDLSHLYLAVLSACETSVGTDTAASLDVASLAGAFMAAGAPSVLGSLWKVSDDSTTQLFVSFYSAFLELGAGDALRGAQLAVRARPGLAHPYYWAAFVLYGWDK